MKRSLLVLVSGLGMASAADAVSVAIVADQAFYFQGQTVTLDIVVDATGASDNAVFGRLEFDPTILPGASASQNALTSLGLDWVLGFLSCPDVPDTGACIAFNQIGPILSPFTVEQPAGFVLSTVEFTAGAIGTTTVEWTVGGPLGFDFFGLTDAPSITVEVVPVPEPATAALLVLGLVAFGARRARS